MRISQFPAAALTAPILAASVGRRAVPIPDAALGSAGRAAALPLLLGDVKLPPHPRAKKSVLRFRVFVTVVSWENSPVWNRLGIVEEERRAAAPRNVFQENREIEQANDGLSAGVSRSGGAKRTATRSTPQTLDDVDQNAGLPYGLNKSLLPRHVAIIMDGNSRWARRKGWPVSAGYRAGVKALRDVVRISCEWGIQVLTVFAFSTENWFRPQVEIRFLMDLFEKVLKEELLNFMKDNIQVHVIGDVAQVPKSLQGLITFAEKTTEGNTGLKLIVAVGYGGRLDIVKACQRVAAEVEKGLLKPEDITESILDDKLATSWMGEVKNPDLLIRTSGEQRLSNFLLWQLAYTELFFVDSFWPEFGETQYANVLLSYQQRNRRFGRQSQVQAIVMYRHGCALLAYHFIPIFDKF